MLLNCFANLLIAAMVFVFGKPFGKLTHVFHGQFPLFCSVYPLGYIRQVARLKMN